jgi:hypothetical protein
MVGGHLVDPTEQMIGKTSEDVSVENENRAGFVTRNDVAFFDTNGTSFATVSDYTIAEDNTFTSYISRTQLSTVPETGSSLQGFELGMTGASNVPDTEASTCHFASNSSNIFQEDQKYWGQAPVELATFGNTSLDSSTNGPTMDYFW